MTVTTADVRLIYSTTLSDEQLEAALAQANLVVDEQMRPVCSMSEARYDMIIKYLTAHFASVTADYGSGDVGPLKSQKIGMATETYATSVEGGDFAYASTPWGQQAITLDSCGILVGIGANKGLKAQLRVV